MSRARLACGVCRRTALRSAAKEVELRFAMIRPVTRRRRNAVDPSGSRLAGLFLTLSETRLRSPAAEASGGCKCG